MKLTGLDFETANGSRGSICSAGCAVFENGIVTEKTGMAGAAAQVAGPCDGRLL